MTQSLCTACSGIGTVALKIEEAANEAIEHLIGFFNYSRMGSEYIPSAAIIVVKDLLRYFFVAWPTRTTCVCTMFLLSVNTHKGTKKSFHLFKNV
jgi:hypothetical protein